jgi:RNA-directed DNA polymerase
LGGGDFCVHGFHSIISFENLLASWQEFLSGKQKRKDVAQFSFHFLDNLILLHKELASMRYRHGAYQAFRISDPKPRDIHKAHVRDRLLHHAIYRVLYPYFDTKFIYDSYSCRKYKGTLKAIQRFERFGWKVSQNNTQSCWILKCDIRKFFANIDHDILNSILRKHLKDENTLWLFGQVIDSFYTDRKQGKGLPLGNLTSQLLVNVYMNEFDQYVKHTLKVKYYIRYADDFVVFAQDRNYLVALLSQFAQFLRATLKLEIHPNKVYIKQLNSGLDFLGWVNFPNHRVLRTSTKRKMLRALKNDPKEAALTSYLGLLKHGDTQKLIARIDKKHKV